jgi:hypothetical protein
MRVLSNFPLGGLLAVVLAIAAGCDDDGDNPAGASIADAGADVGGDTGAPPDATAGDAADAAGPPVYALMTQVYRDDDRDVYVYLSSTLDIPGVALAEAREFGGVANLAPIGGRLLISSGEQPVITAFEITPDLKWVEKTTVSFAGYPLEDNANFYYQFVLDDHTAYLPVEATKRIIWDPTTMEIEGLLDDTSLALERDGLRLEAGGNRNSARFDGPVLQALFYHDKDWVDFGKLSHVVAYDTRTHKEMKVIDIPCPGMSLATRDEQGNTYYGTWGYVPARALYKTVSAPCVARIKPDLTLDAAFTTDLTQLTGGRIQNNFRYIGGGKAIANVLHHEALGVDLTAPFDPAVQEKIWETGPHWRLWMFDLPKNEAHMVEGIDVAIGSGAQFAVLDGRTFVFLPYDEWARTKVYELDSAGKATARFETAGDVFKWVRVR